MRHLPRLAGKSLNKSGAWWPEGLCRPPGLVESDSFRDPQTGGAGAGVGCDLGIRWSDGTARDGTEGGPVAAGADWLLGWADTVFGLDVDE